MSIIDPVWCATGTKTPAPSDEKIAQGFVGGDDAIVEYFNWVLNRADVAANQAHRLAAAVAFGNYKEAGTEPVDGDMRMLVVHPDIGSGDSRWLAATPADSPSLIYYSDNNGITWSASSSLGAQLRTSSRAAIDTTRFIVPISNATSQVRYSTDGTSWTADTGPSTAGATGSTAGICTKYPDSDFVIVGTTDGDIAHADNVGGTWTNVSVSTSTNDNIERIVWLGSANFVALDEDGETYQTSDDGNNWAATTTSPADVAVTTTAFYCMDANRSTNVICVAGTGGSGTMEVIRSVDGGNSWSMATTSNLKQTYEGRDMRHVGAGVWVIASTNHSGFLCISHDDGASWHDCVKDRTLPTFANEVGSVITNGKTVMISDDNISQSDFAVSRTLPGFNTL